MPSLVKLFVATSSLFTGSGVVLLDPSFSLALAPADSELTLEAGRNSLRPLEVVVVDELKLLLGLFFLPVDEAVLLRRLWAVLPAPSSSPLTLGVGVLLLELVLEWLPDRKLPLRSLFSLSPGKPK